MHIQLSGRLGNQLFEIAHGLSLAGKQKELPQFFWDRFNYPSGVDQELFHSSYFKSLGVSFEKNDILGSKFLVLDKIRSHNKIIEKNICKLLKIKREHNNLEFQNIRLVSGFYQDYQWAENSYHLMAPLMEELEMQFDVAAVKWGIDREYQCIHFRRGDYVNYPGTFGILSPNYYQRVVDIEATTVVLTDSPEEAKNYFSGMRNIRLIEPMEASPLLAVKIMSRASSVISSNSTLSWWGSFFAFKNGASILMPKPFYVSSEHSSLMHPGFQFAPSDFLLS